MSEVTHRLTQKLGKREAVGGRPQRSPANQSEEARDRVGCLCFVCLFDRITWSFRWGNRSSNRGT